MIGSSGVIRVGSRVCVRDSDDRVEFNIVESHEADIAEARVSAESPLGRALLGRQVGDEVRYRAPGGVQAAESSHLVTRAGRRRSVRVIAGAVAVGDPGSAQQSPSARRPYLTVLPGRLDMDVREPGPVTDRDDGDGAGASRRVSPRRRCP